MVEAIGLLLLARMFIRLFPLGWWRSTLGSLDRTAPQDSNFELARPVIQAVNRACQRLPINMVCLPRAIAAQWMLGRRGHRSALVFGISPGQESQSQLSLHAWVEAGDRILIGDDGKTYHRGMVLSR